MLRQVFYAIISTLFDHLYRLCVRLATACARAESRYADLANTTRHYRPNRRI